MGADFNIQRVKLRKFLQCRTKWPRNGEKGKKMVLVRLVPIYPRKAEGFF
jgi:hypothetical protein